jgi:hypothetical protein|tara:strand:- start:518 stop:808 length:291 start_codon:yes stop_codon:yes gene_type:complete
MLDGSPIPVPKEKQMAKISVELEVDDQSLEEILMSLRSIERMAKATDEMCEDFSFLSKAIASNQREMKKLTTSVTNLLKEMRNGNDARGKGKEEGG